MDIGEARAQLSRLVDRAVRGEEFRIAKAGKPPVKVAALASPAKGLGSLTGEIAVSNDFDRIVEAEMTASFTPISEAQMTRACLGRAAHGDDP